MPGTVRTRNKLTAGTLGIIICPMFDDNILYNFSKDDEEKIVTLVNTGHNRNLREHLDKMGQKYEMLDWLDIRARKYHPVEGKFNILIYSIDLALHSKPEKLKADVEQLTAEMQPYVDAIGFYLGTCGTYNWDLPKWCESKGFKPSEMYRDGCGNPCDDCVGVAISGGPRYLEMQKKYTGHFYLFPGMANNYEDFMLADQADAAATAESLTDEMREVLGIEPGRDGYIKWLFQLGGYEYVLKIDTGIGDRENFDENVEMVAKRIGLNVKVAEEGWATLEPTDSLYLKCKALLN